MLISFTSVGQMGCQCPDGPELVTPSGVEGVVRDWIKPGTRRDGSRNHRNRILPGRAQAWHRPTRRAQPVPALCLRHRVCPNDGNSK